MNNQKLQEPKLRAYHNDPEIKAKYAKRFAAHRAADEVIQGTGFDSGQGCFVGCTLNKYDHSQFPVELGWPVWLAHLCDTIFEGLSQKDAPQFGTDLLDAVPVGADLENVKWEFLVRVLERRKAALINDDAPSIVQVRDAIQGSIDYCNAELNGTATEEKRLSAGRAAARATEAAAWAARATEAAAWAARAASRAARAARATEAAAWAARAAAWAARAASRAAAEAVVWAAEYKMMRDDLLILLAHAK